MDKVIPLHQYQYKYKKRLEIKNATKSTKPNKKFKNINDTSQKVKYQNKNISEQMSPENLKINLTKKTGNTEFKQSCPKNLFFNNYNNNIYKKNALFRNEHQNLLLKKELTSKNNTNKISSSKNSNINIDITEIKSSNIINNNENKVSDFTFKDKYSYSDQNKLRKNKYLDKNLKNNLNNVYISSSCINDNSPSKGQNISTQKLNLSYLDFILLIYIL